MNSRTEEVLADVEIGLESGEDQPYPDTLSAANNLAHVLRMVDEYEYARRIDEDTLARRRRVLGADHPDALSSANNLVIDLSAVGQHRRARQLDEYINERTAVLSALSAYGDRH